MIQGFLFCCFQKHNNTAHYPSVCTSPRMTVHTTDRTDHQARVGSRCWGMGGPAKPAPAVMELLPQHLT